LLAQAQPDAVEQLYDERARSSSYFARFIVYIAYKMQI
jgi:hypothetical protein